MRLAVVLPLMNNKDYFLIFFDIIRIDSLFKKIFLSYYIEIVKFCGFVIGLVLR